MANLSLQDKLNTLQSVQSNIQDGYRLYSDGSIKTITITESSETGWYLLARPVSGAATVFLSFFPDGFLKTNSMREAIDVRDDIIRAMSNDRRSTAEKELKSNSDDALPSFL